MVVNIDEIRFAGGLDTDTPPRFVRPGMLRDGQNVYQGVSGGYHTFQGYERFDGRAKPSAATYSTLAITKTGSISVGDVLTDNGGTNYGTVIAISDTLAVLSKVTGTFVAGNIKVGAAVVGTCSAAQILGGAGSRLLNAMYTNLAADLYRDDIGTVGGAACSGSVLGIWYYDGDWYAFRNNAAGTATLMYKSSTSGWTAVDLGYEISFTSGGTYEIAEGDEITGAISGATATVGRVILTSGTWAGGDAAGRLILTEQTDTFQSENLDVGASTNVATIAGDSSAITFAVPSGRFEFVNHNFTGASDTWRMYGCDGKNRAFEFDGTVFVPIITGMATDTPTHITVHKNQLVLSFKSVFQASNPGDVHSFTLLTNDSEVGVGDDITAFVPQRGSASSGALAIFSRNTYGILYGNDSGDWILDHHKDARAGAIAYTAQRIGHTYSLDDLGIVQLHTTDKYGNFGDSAVSNHIKAWLNAKIPYAVASCIIQKKSQYWVFFSDGSALCSTVNGGKIMAMCPMKFPNAVTCVCSDEDGSGAESTMFGSSDGYVREMYKGTSMDGADIEWFAYMSWYDLRTPTVKKRYRKASVEVAGDGYSAFNIGANYEYSGTGIQQLAYQAVEANFALQKWDTSGLKWDAGTAFWDGKDLEPKHLRMYGSGTNLSLMFLGKSDYHSPVKLSSAIIHYSLTREVR